MAGHSTDEDVHPSRVLTNVNRKGDSVARKNPDPKSRSGLGLGVLFALGFVLALSLSLPASAAVLTSPTIGDPVECIGPAGIPGVRYNEVYGGSFGYGELTGGVDLDQNGSQDWSGLCAVNTSLSPPRLHICQCDSGTLPDPEYIQCADSELFDNGTIGPYRFLYDSGQTRSFILDLSNEPDLTNVTISDYTYEVCLDSGFDRSSDPQDGTVHCGVTVAVTCGHIGSADVECQESVTGIVDRGDGTDIDCPNDPQIVNQTDTPTNLVSNSKTENRERRFYDDSGLPQCETARQHRSYDPASNKTYVCDLTYTKQVTSIDCGDCNNALQCGSAPTVKNSDCRFMEGDATFHGTGVGTEIEFDGSNWNLVPSNGGDVNTSAGGGSGYSVATGASGGFLQIEGLDKLCDDPNGCEDFAEITTSYDTASDLNAVSDFLSDITSWFGTQESDLGSLDPSSLLPSGSEGNVSDIANVLPSGGGCTPYTASMPNGETLTIDCDVFDTIKGVVTFALWASLLLYIRAVFFAVPVARTA